MWINCLKYMSSSSWTWFFVFALVSVPMDLTPDACLQLHCLWLHHLWQVQQGSLIPHCPYMHVIDINVYVYQDVCSLSKELLPTINMDNWLMHSDEPEVQLLHGCLERWYFIKYFFLKLYSNRYCSFLFSLLSTCNYLTMCSFLAIKNITLELVASAYAFVALFYAVGCLHTSDTITHSQKCTRDAWTSRVALCMISQLYVVTRWRICCAHLLPGCPQGFQCLLDHLGLA